ncbi:MAG: phosphoribosylformylglycinamidine synthase subunit PurQ [Coprococcus sp.]
MYDTKDIHICGHKIAQPTVFIPVFPGTNCEYDSAKAFERAGAKVITKVFRNMDAADIVDSVSTFEKAIAPGADHHVPGRISARVTSRTVQQNSLQLHSRMQRLKEAVEETAE